MCVLFSLGSKKANKGVRGREGAYPSLNLHRGEGENVGTAGKMNGEAKCVYKKDRST